MKAKKKDFIIQNNKPLITVDPSLPDFEDDPYFEKKTQAAKKLLRRVGLPPQLTKKSI